MSSAAETGSATERFSAGAAAGWFVLFALAAALQVYPLGWEDDLLPGNADGVHSSWVLAWLARELPRDPLGVLNANVLHPEERALAFSEHVISAGPLAWPLYAFTGSAVVAHNGTLIASLALSALATLLLVRELTGSVAAGVVAGELFAFTTANLDSVARIQIVSSQWTPLALYFLCRTLRTRRYVDGIACGVAFGLQGLASAYYELFLAQLLMLTVPLLLAAMPPPRLRSFPWLPLLAGVVVAALVLLPVNLAQWETLSRLDSARAPRPTALAAYWSALPGNWLYGAAFGAAGVGYDNRYFHGFLPLALAGIGVAAASSRRRRQLPEWGRRLALPFAWIGTMAFVLAFGPELPTPWGAVPSPISQLTGWLPGMAEVRVPSRYIMFVRLSLAVFAGIGVAALLPQLRRASRAGTTVALTAIAVLAPLEHLSIPLDVWRVPAGERVPAVYRWLERLPGRPAIVEYPPFPVRLRRDESLWEYLSTFHWKPLVNGYPSFYPVHYDFVYDVLLDLPSQQSFGVLRVLGVEYLVYHPRASGVPERVRAVQRFENGLGGLEGRQLRLVARFDGEGLPAPDRRGVLGEERVYRVLPGISTPPDRPRLREQGAPLPRDGWSCTSRPAVGCESALDGDLRTAFETGSPQRPLDFLRVTFPTPTRVSGLALVSGVRSRFYPTRIRVSGLVDGRWRPLPHRSHELEFLRDMLRDPRTAALELHLHEPAHVSGVEVQLLPSHRAFNPWHVLELQVYP